MEQADTERRAPEPRILPAGNRRGPGVRVGLCRISDTYMALGIPDVDAGSDPAAGIRAESQKRS